MNLIYYITYLVWIVSEVLLNRMVRSGNSDKKSADHNTEIYLWTSIVISITIGVIVSFYFPMSIFENAQYSLLGIIIIIVGIIFRFITIKQLGEYFTVDVTIRKNHQLIQSGIYKYLRHPSYSFALLSFLGLGISLNNWLSIAIIFIPTFIAFIYRINIEEKALAEQFGNQYTQYQNNTKRLIPFIY